MIRKISAKTAQHLMLVAEKSGMDARGNAAWLLSRGDQVREIYLCPRSLPPRKSEFIRCSLLVFDSRSRGIGMNLDVKRRDYKKLPWAREEDMIRLALGLAVRLPLVRMADDPMFVEGVDFGDDDPLMS